MEDSDEEMEDSAEIDNLIGKKQVSILKGHTKEVYVCAWNSRKEILASG